MLTKYTTTLTGDLEPNDSGEVYLVDDVDADRRELLQEIGKLQIALAFWLPCVPNDDPEIASRVGDDAYLLAGAPEIPSETAESLGWMSRRR